MLHRLTEQEAGDIKAWIRGGRIASSQPDLHRFAKDWTGQATRLFPHDREVLEQRAEALLLTGDIEDSLSYWKRITSPNNARVTAAEILVQIAFSGTATVPPSL